jgi:hypothetical protein
VPDVGSEAAAFDLERGPPRRHVRLTRQGEYRGASAAAEWFRLAGVLIGNGTPDYPNGDNSRSSSHGAPPVWAGTTGPAQRDPVGDRPRRDRRGRQPNRPAVPNAPAPWTVPCGPSSSRPIPTRRKSSAARSSTPRVASARLYPENYEDPEQRRQVKGLCDSTKRPLY